MRGRSIWTGTRHLVIEMTGPARPAGTSVSSTGSSVAPCESRRGRRTVRSVETATKPCKHCGSTFEAHTAATVRCTVCVRYDALAGNAKKQRRDGHAPGLGITREEFAAWFSTQERNCRFCDIDEEQLPKLGLLTQMGMALQRLGVDRLDPSQGYSPANMALCCFACNKAKSNTFDDAEMAVIGRAIATNWTRRLAALGVDWEPRR